MVCLNSYFLDITAVNLKHPLISLVDDVYWQSTASNTVTSLIDVTVSALTK